MIKESESCEMQGLFAPIQESIDDIRMDIPIQKLFDECLNFISMVNTEE